MDKIRVLLADDNREFAQMLRDHLSAQSDMEVIGVAYNGNEVMEQLSRQMPDVWYWILSCPISTDWAFWKNFKKKTFREFPK